jgi:hypothetical protein
MLPKTVSNFIDNILLAAFAKMPNKLAKRVLSLLYKNPTLGDTWGYYIRQLHYYEPLPNFAKLTPEQVLQKRAISPINWSFLEQIELIKELSTYTTEIKNLVSNRSDEKKIDFYNVFFRELDAAIYYALIRYLKPSKILEIGCVYSTIIADIAIKRNQTEGKGSKLIGIEPYPTPILEKIQIDLIKEQIETINLNFFEQLNAGNILFIDSTHTVKFGSDVCREILEILPALSSSVWIHFHDIFFPYDYPPNGFWKSVERGMNNIALFCHSDEDIIE